MPKRSKSTATAVATPAGNGQSNLGVSKTPPLLTTTKSNTSKKSSQAKQVPKTTVTSGDGSTKTQAVGKALKDPATPEIVKKVDKIKEKKPAQRPEQSSLELSLSERKGGAVKKLEVKKEDSSRPLSLDQLGGSSSSWVENRDTASQQGSYSNPDIVKCQPFNPHDSFFHT
jgi:hypothetical protein